MKNVLHFWVWMVMPMSLFGQEKLITPSAIKHVTVFSSGAQIRREAESKIKEGKSILQLTGLTPDLDPKTILVKTNEGITILAVSHSWNTSLASFNNKAIDSLHNVVLNLDSQTGKLEVQLDVLEEQLTFLDVNKEVGSRTTGLSVEQLEKAFTYYENKMRQIHENQYNLRARVDSIQNAKKLLLAKISQLRGTPVPSTSEIEILVLTKTEIEAKLEISYIVRNAGWTPTYDIRSKDINSPVELIYKADIHQLTGEEWKYVNLSLSNASPYGRQTAPDLEPWRLTTLSHTVIRRIGPADNGATTRVINGNIRSTDGSALSFANVQANGRNYAVQTDLNGNFSMIVPRDVQVLNIDYTGYESKQVLASDQFMNIDLDESQALSEVVVSAYKTPLLEYNNTTAGYARSKKITHEQQPVIVNETQLTVDFTLEIPATIPSDGRNKTLEFHSFDLPAEYRYETTPKLDPYVYLIATLVDWEKFHLLEGQANLYYQNTYIGKTIIDPSSLSDTLEISLGRDPDVLMERVKAEEYNKRTFLGTNTITEKSFRIIARNKKEQPIHIRISDQIPVSINDAITVNATQLSGGLKDENSGIIKWDLNIGSTSNEELILSYAVKFPSKEKVVLE